jgi:hypothetical protein
MDLTYNYDEEWLSGSLLEVVSSRGFAGARYYTGQRITARQIAEWLQDRRLSLPAGSRTVHHLDSHDTFWWGEKAQFRHEAFGLEASRALFAMFALLDGGIMNYVGAERGSEDFYRNILRLRQNTPALRVGTCDYLAIQAVPEMVLPLLRSHAGEHFIPVINLSPAPVNAHLKLPVGKLGFKDGQDWTVFDVLNHEPIVTKRESGDLTRLTTEQVIDLAVGLPAYGVRVLQIQAVSG